ncbi:MAG: exodeoxyribonuclease III [Cytophagales bacterium]|nr:MAG: exodeoxyribonuclease III [Cytophagales bacterium]
MKIISYNVNGIRAAIRKGWLSWLAATQADVVCLQEVKALENEIPTEEIAALGYTYQYYQPAISKKGYSGVAILSKVAPIQVVKGYGENNTNQDIEGRLIRADFESGLSVMSVYMPSGTSGSERQGYKMDWMTLFFDYIRQLQPQLQALLVCGDYNIAHEPIDIHNPKSNAKTSGFLPEERAWLSKFITELQMVDTFRHLNKEPHQYSWWSSRLATTREKNLGWRIDYQLISGAFAHCIERALLLNEAQHSDHCPTFTEINMSATK